MTQIGLAEWWWWVLAGALAAGGTLLLGWALFKDRARGRRRCPKCWYSMQGVTGLRCPECGLAARSERALFRTRRRWGRAALASVVLLAAFVGTRVALVGERGLPGLVPTTALVLLAPAGDTPGRVVWWAGTPAAPANLAERFSEEAWARVLSEGSWQWQRRTWVKRWLKSKKIDPSDLVEVPARWPRGADVPVFLETQAAHDTYAPMIAGSGEAEDGVARGIMREWTAPASLRRAGRVRVPLTFVINRTEVSWGGVRKPCEECEPGELLEGVSSEEIDARVGRALRPGLLMRTDANTGRRTAAVVVADRSESPDWQAIDFGIAAHVEVRLEGRTLGRGRTACNWDYPVWKDWRSVEIEWEPGGEAAAAEHAERVTIKLKGDPSLALPDYMRWPFSKRPAAWSGSVERTPTIIPNEEELFGQGLNPQDRTFARH